MVFQAQGREGDSEADGGAMNDHPSLEELVASDGYLSRCKSHLNRLQRDRRARMVRIDYMPGDVAQAVIEAKRATLRPDSAESTNSATLDAILIEWAALTGIECGEVERPKSPGTKSELCDEYAQARMSPIAERSARAQESGGATGINAPIAGVCAGAYESGTAAKLAALEARQAAQATTLRVPCHAKRHRDGKPCQALSEPGRRRCRFHGGRSTGPRTPEGRERALRNLRQYQGTT